MSLDLDDRQRAMLQEMHVPVWLPHGAKREAAIDVAPVAEVSPPAVAARPAARAAQQAPALVPGTRPVVQAQEQTPVGDTPTLDGLGWPALREAAAACQACGLCAGRRNTTLAPLAAQQADWLIVGDPPDEDEDRNGQPFAEQAGVLLDNMLKAAGARRAKGPGGEPPSAYVTNAVKCRSPQGRNPQPAELAQCAHYLQREITLVQPKVIVAMGRFAIQSLLAEQPELATQPLGKLRGTVYHYRGVPVVATYHPKVLLRASADKAKAWADLNLAMDVVGA